MVVKERHLLIRKDLYTNAMKLVIQNVWRTHHTLVITILFDTNPRSALFCARTLLHCEGRNVQTCSMRPALGSTILWLLQVSWWSFDQWWLMTMMTRLGFYYLTAATGLTIITVMMVSDDGDLLIFQSLDQQSNNFSMWRAGSIIVQWLGFKPGTTASIRCLWY